VSVVESFSPVRHTGSLKTNGTLSAAFRDWALQEIFLAAAIPALCAAVALGTLIWAYRKAGEDRKAGANQPEIPSAKFQT
jgi:hypothetical protein